MGKRNKRIGKRKMILRKRRGKRRNRQGAGQRGKEETKSEIVVYLSNRHHGAPTQ